MGVYLRMILPAGLPALVLVVLIISIAFSQRSADADQSPNPIDPGPGTQYLDPTLWGLLQRNANGETGLPTNTKVHLVYGDMGDAG